MKLLLAVLATLAIVANYPVTAAVTGVQIIPAGTTESGYRLALDTWSVGEGTTPALGKFVGFTYYVMTVKGGVIRGRHAATKHCFNSAGKPSWVLLSVKKGEFPVVHATSQHSKDFLKFVCAVYKKQIKI